MRHWEGWSVDARIERQNCKFLQRTRWMRSRMSHKIKRVEGFFSCGNYKVVGKFRRKIWFFASKFPLNLNKLVFKSFIIFTRVKLFAFITPKRSIHKFSRKSLFQGFAWFCFAHKRKAFSFSLLTSRSVFCAQFSFKVFALFLALFLTGSRARCSTRNANI